MNYISKIYYFFIIKIFKSSFKKVIRKKISTFIIIWWFWVAKFFKSKLKIVSLVISSLSCYDFYVVNLFLKKLSLFSFLNVFEYFYLIIQLDDYFCSVIKKFLCNLFVFQQNSYSYLFIPAISSRLEFIKMNFKGYNSYSIIILYSSILSLYLWVLISNTSCIFVSDFKFSD